MEKLNYGKIPIERWDVAGKRVYVVNEHHHVLLPWVIELQNNNKVNWSLSFDHHNDTLLAFLRLAEAMTDTDDYACEKLQKQLSHRTFTTLDEWDEALRELRHDEHLDLAIEQKIVDNAIVFSHDLYAWLGNARIGVISALQLARKNTNIVNNEDYRAEFDMAIDDEVLGRCYNDLVDWATLNSAELDRPFVLDIDLDYFKTQKSLQPEKRSIFYELIRKSSFITVSKEKDWVRLLSMPGEKLTADIILNSLFEHFEQAQKEI